MARRAEAALYAPVADAVAERPLPGREPPTQPAEPGAAVPQIHRNPVLDDALATALVRVWTDVSNAGGAVGFVPPVEPADVRVLADAVFDRVRGGVDDIVVAFDDDEPVAFGFLVTNEFSLARHWGTVKRLQRHPRRSGRGDGAAVLAGLEAAAVDRGLERVVLTVRGNTGRERFYVAKGYTIEALLTGRLQLADGVVVDEYHLSKALTDEARARGGAPLLVQRLDAELPLPARAHPGDAGLDLHARVAVRLAPGERAVVPTGVAVALPPGHVGLVHPRSGLAARHGLGVVNAPGTIDEGYRGEIQVIVVNHDPRAPIALARGDRIAQLVIQRVEAVVVTEVAELPPAARGAGGFGSTGR
jgi:dUTP pyrophosphatase